MRTRLSTASGMLTVAAIASGCTTPVYSPPEHSAASDRCPIGEVRVCRDHYPSRLEPAGEAPMMCMCRNVQDIQAVH